MGMVKSRKKLSGLRKLSLGDTKPGMVTQVRKVLSSLDQKLIVMMKD